MLPEHKDSKESLEAGPFFIVGPVLAFVLGPVYGFAVGVVADYGYFKTGAYGGVLDTGANVEGGVVEQRRAMPFGAVFDPWNPAFDFEAEICCYALEM